MTDDTSTETDSGTGGTTADTSGGSGETATDRRTVLLAGVGERLGTGLARVFARAGDAVVAVARSEGYVSSLAAELRADGYEALAVQADVTDRAAVERAVETAEREYGAVDVVVHNAGATGGTLEDAEEFARPVRTRIEGGGNLAAAVLPAMRERGEGTVVFTGTTYAHDGSERLPGWGAAAFGARGLARSLARRAGPDGVHVCYVAVGGTIPPADATTDPERTMSPVTVAEGVLDVVEQPATAWSHEVDLRPREHPP